jgi:glycosyltransferase involved in cell wall biosynthesis
MDDGSADNTVALLQSYSPRVTILQQAHGGVASSRNAMCSRAKGDILAFLDHDDLWHPDYLRKQSALFASFPEAVASFTGHEDFEGDQEHQFDASPLGMDHEEIIDSVDFLRRYHETSGSFMSVSFCCIPKRVDPFGREAV